MAIIFKNMRSEDEFEEMCRQLVRAEHPQSVPVEASPGDEGMDSFEGVIDEKIEHVWQFKHFPYGIGKSQQDQIRKSLKDAIREHSPKKWTFITSTDLRPGNHRWVKKQQNDFPQVTVAVVPATEVRLLLMKHQDIRKQYFPLQDEKIDALMRMKAGDGESGSLPKSTILQNVRNDVAILNDNSPHLKYTFSFDESGTRIGVEPRTAEANGMTLAKMTFAFPKDDPEASAALKKYMADVDAGHPTTVAGEYVTIHGSVFDEFMGENRRISELRILPKVPKLQLPTRIRFFHEDEEVIIPFVDLRLVRKGRRELEFSNAQQGDIPLKISMSFRDTLPASFHIWLSGVAGMHPSEVIDYEKALSIIGQPGATTELESLSTGVKIASSIALTSEETPNGRLRFYEDLLLIENHLDQQLVLPEEITQEDYASVLGVARALRVGRASKRGTARAVLIPIDRSQLDEPVKTAEPVTWVTKDGIEDFRLFGRVYEFGIEGIITGPLAILEEGLADGGILIGITGEIHFTYSNGRCVGMPDDLRKT